MNDESPSYSGKPEGITHFRVPAQNYHLNSTFAASIDPLSHANISSDQSCPKPTSPHAGKYQVPKLHSTRFKTGVAKGTRSAPILRRSTSASHNNGLLHASQDCEEGIMLPLNITRVNDVRTLQKSKKSLPFQHSPVFERNNRFHEYSAKIPNKVPCTMSSNKVNGGYRLSMSSSNASFFHDNCIKLNRTKSTLSDTVQHSSNQRSAIPESPPTSRPRSLYVPFVGCVESPPLPPGKGAHDILMALSYTPIEKCTISKHRSPYKLRCSPSQPSQIYHCEGSQNSLSSNWYNLNAGASDIINVRQSGTPPLCPLDHDDVANGQISLKLANGHKDALRREGANENIRTSSNEWSVRRQSSSHSYDTPCFDHRKKHAETLRSKSKGQRSPPLTHSMRGILCYSTADVTVHPDVSSTHRISPFVNAKSSHSHQNDQYVNMEKQTGNESKCPTNGKKFNPPVFSPTHPLHHSENTVISVTHPPVLHPPPELSIGEEKLSYSPIGHTKNTHTCKSFGGQSVSNWSTASQSSSHSSSSVDHGSCGTAKSISSYSSFSSSSISSNCIYPYVDQNQIFLNPLSVSNASAPSNVKSLQAVNGTTQNKVQSHCDYAKLESIREISPCSTNNELNSKPTFHFSSKSCQ